MAWHCIPGGSHDFDSPVGAVEVRQAAGEALDFTLKPAGSLTCPLGFPLSLVHPSARHAGRFHPLLHSPLPLPACASIRVSLVA